MENVVVDLTNLRKIFNKIDKCKPYEFTLITLFTTKPNVFTSPIGRLTNIILNDIYHTDGIEYNFMEIGKFFNLNSYVKAVNTFLDVLTIYVKKELSPYIDRVWFDKVIRDDDQLLVSFYYEE